MYTRPICFLPEDYVERRSNRRANTICAALFIIVMLAIGSALVLSEQSLRVAVTEHTLLEKTYAAAATRVDQVRQMQDEQRLMVRRARDSASIVDKVPRSVVLAEVTNALPPGVTLVAFNLDSVNAPQPAGQSPTPLVTLRIVGTGESDVQVSQFVNTLTRSKILKDVNLRASQPATVDDKHPTTDSVARRFTVDMALDPKAATIIAQEPKLSTTAIELKPE
ncbi:hypothetical protein BH10PLA1_BH10PLA1_19170 [soil metagenome]